MGDGPVPPGAPDSADAWPCSAQDPLPETGVTFQTSDAALQGLYDHGDTQYTPHCTLNPTSVS